MQRKGIVLAGGSGTRLYPITKAVSKQLLPVYDKPLIYYPLSTLMLSGIRDILIITTPQDLHLFQQLLSDGSGWGVNIQYAVQANPNGIAEALIIAKSFIGNSNIALILGDNIFYGHNFSTVVASATSRIEGATIFAYHVNDPERYGVVAFDDQKKVTGIEEKPKSPQSNYAVTGLYFYDNDSVEYAETIKPSSRGELEITDLNNCYLDTKLLYVEVLGRGFAWFDAGTHKSMLEASQFIAGIEARGGQKLCCPEEIAYNQNWIDDSMLEEQAERLRKSPYGEYLLSLLNETP
ncbi:MAG: glucose-1-phosphate thymidylyltransferase RfbA [Pseudomonadota bacterium]|nr:glucose-1-phosphate thymidylyltransferase RfbA [Pseudomonadota bacterium]